MPPPPNVGLSVFSATCQRPISVSPKRVGAFQRVVSSSIATIVEPSALPRMPTMIPSSNVPCATCAPKRFCSA
jgi:hypothetical protein